MTNNRVIHSMIVLALLMGLSSCALPATSIAPLPTQTSLPPTPPPPVASPTTAPTSTPSPMPVEPPTEIPGSGNLYLPIGIAVNTTSSDKVYFYDLVGEQIGELQLANLGTLNPQQIHIAGSLTYSPGPVLPPFVYYALDNGGELWLNNNNDLSLIRQAPNLFSIYGVPGKQLMIYSQLEFADIGLKSLLYIGDLQTLALADPILDNTNSQSYAIKPMAISIQNDQAVGVWYTTEPYGIGGDIVFEPTRSLQYFDLTNYQVKTHLDLSKSPAGISDDQTWIAYTRTGEISPMSIVHNLDFSTSITIPLGETNDRGSGDAVFSPANQYIAWKEASGSLMDQPSTFHETIRIATLDGNILAEIPDTSLVDTSGFSQISWLLPLGWLDAQTLALQVRGESWENACIVSIKYDGSDPTFITSGAFLGFLYP